ncbi:glycoside hydrolase family 65 protein [Kineobactrum sediminis]|uniref:glycoside hydrolase family 65 protein n=1 Tax=Kineobactrum sediminis TaxID=1905677 RepID=UPI0019D44E88|nr:glycoside hydrolase family 65 protein [Kineobactrum sediminis]
MTAWTLSYNEFTKEEEALREALCTLGNGYFASRGAAPEASADDTHYPGTYIAGCYNRLQDTIAEKTIENESLVNAPNWLALNFRIEDGNWFNLDDAEIIDYEQQLDIKRGLLTRTIRFRDEAQRTTRIEQQRLVSMDEPHIAAMTLQIKAEDWGGGIEVCSALDGRVINDGVPRYRDLSSRHLQGLGTESVADDTMLLTVETNQSHIRIALAATTRFFEADQQVYPGSSTHQEDDYIACYYSTRLDRDKPLYIEKVMALYTGRDYAISEPSLEARKAVADADRFDGLCNRHIMRWSQLWKHFDFDIEHDDKKEEKRSELVLRLHIFHLIQTTSPHVMNLDVGVPARGLHGEAYRGHIFWDELFVFPLFNLRMPEITRALLGYRYHRLGEARRAAKDEGYRGAMFPWQSGSNGREESQRVHLNPKSGNWIPDNSRLQRHINIAVAYNVWQYYEATNDKEFMSFYGAEMVMEIARFWASATSYNESLGRYEILNVMGPDEYHDAYPDADKPGLNNNAYTNIMAVWIFCRALEIRDILDPKRFDEVCELIRLSPEELVYWDQLSHRLYVPFHDDGIISQFDGYEKLAPFDWEGYRRKYGDIQRLDRILEAEDDTPNNYQVSKQADVLMLFYLLSAEVLEVLFRRLDYPFEYETIPRNIDYYMQRTSHGSTLSRAVSSWVLARSNRPGAWPLFIEALESDVGDIQGGTTQEGIHTGAMAGTVDLIQRCFTGIEIRDDVLWFNPTLPEGLTSLCLNIRYRQQVIDLRVTVDRISIGTQPCSENPITVGVKSETFTLAPGETRDLPL